MAIDEIKKLSLPERILIVEEIWDSIIKENKLTESKHRAKKNVCIYPISNAEQLAALYGEFSDEDSCLAEQGIADYIDGLKTEDER
jgi:hypothetical protein